MDANMDFSESLVQIRCSWALYQLTNIDKFNLNEAERKLMIIIY